jgi:hypothetical protein
MTAVTVTRHSWRELISVPHVVIGAAMVGMLGLLVRRVADPDSFWHVRTAQWMLDNHSLPQHDLYTYTVANNTWTDHEWLSELLIYGLQRVHGELAVGIAFGAILWAGFFLILRRIQLRPAPFLITAVALALGALAGNLVWGPRPQMITFFFVCLELYWLETYLSGRSRAIYALPFVVAVWANCHGGFAVVFLFLGIAVLVELTHYLVDRSHIVHRVTAQRLTLIGLACAVAGLLTPNGVNLYRYAWQTETGSSIQDFVREWQSPNFHFLNIRPFEVLLLAVIVGFALKRPRLYDIALTIATLVLAFQAVRHIILFVAAVTPALAWSWGDAWRNIRDVPRWVRRIDVNSAAVRTASVAGLAVVVIGVGVFLRSQLRQQTSAVRENYPVAASVWLDDHPQVGTHLFNEYAWGGYLLDRFYPQPNRRVFIFGETFLMGKPLLDEYSNVVALKSDWRDILARHQVDYIVILQDSPLAGALGGEPDWRLAFNDSVADIFVRSDVHP